MAKTTIRNSSDTKLKKKKKHKKLGPKAVAAMKPNVPRDNPFETIWSRRKFDILGKKHKGEQHCVGLARSRAIDKRKKTLLKEYEQSSKSSVFKDKRIGENNDELAEFDKAIMRSQRQHKLKLNKKSKYNLSDGEEDDFGVLGLGSISERDDFEDEMLSDDDEADADGPSKKSAFLKQINEPDRINPEEGEENKHKTKKEVMEEVILKSKFFKAQKARDKEENEQLMEELDKSFTSLVQSRVLQSLTEPGKLDALKALANTGAPNEHVKKDKLSVNQTGGISKQEEPDDYYKLVGEMILDMRARPSDRTKTPEEIAQEELERLERLEEERKKRMVAADDSSDDENDDAEKSLTQSLRSISGDALGDSFSFDEEPKTRKGWVDEILARREAGESENEVDSSEDSERAEDDGDSEESEEDDVSHDNNEDGKLSLKDWEQSDEENLVTDLEEDGHSDSSDDHEDNIGPKWQKSSKKGNIVESSEGGESLRAKKLKEISEQHSNHGEIPFLIEAPKSLEELCSLVDKCSNENVIEAIHRIRVKASDAKKPAAENRKKMQVFYGILLQYFAVIASKRPLNFELLNLLVKPLMEMSAEIPYFSAICARQRILRTRAQFCEAVKNSESGCWPSFKTLCFLRLWSMIFPSSDFRHAVMTPAILLMSEYLMRCPILSGRDIAMGSFLCTLVLSVLRQSEKFCPEAIVFIRTLLMAATGRKPASSQESQIYHLMELKALRNLLCICNHVNEIGPLNFFVLMDMPEDSSYFSTDNFRASVLATMIDTLRGFVESCNKFSSFPEIFLPISTLLLELAQQDNLPGALQDKSKDIAQLINRKAAEHHMLRRPLQMRRQKPVPIKLLNPKFEENYVKGRDYDPDRERVERRKLRKLLKQEAKGAARELRKDNHFILEVKEKERALQEEERVEKYGKARAFLQEQEHAFKSGQLGKGRKRRR